MNFFGLARRSVFRKPVKSILLLLIVFAISTLLLAGVASKNASIEVQLSLIHISEPTRP